MEFEAFRPYAHKDEYGREFAATEESTLLEMASAEKLEPEELYRQFLESLAQTAEALDGTSFDNPAAFWKEVQRQNQKELVVRKDNPWFLLPTLAEKRNIEVFFRADAPYNNAAVWDPRDLSEESGLKVALYEGQGNAYGAVTLYGFDPDAANVEEWKIEDMMSAFAGHGRSNVRSISGTVPLDAMKFLIARFPLKYMPEHALSEEEAEYKAERSGPAKTYKDFAWRGIVFNKEKQHPSMKSAA